MFIPAYLINLDRSPDRLAIMQERFESLGIPFRRVVAVNGQELSPEDIGAVRIDVPGWKPLSANEVACFLSHRKCWELISLAPEDHGCIFEDDVLLSNSLASFLSHDGWIPAFAEIVKLETDRRRVWIDRRSYRLEGNFELAKLWSGHYRAGGYIVSKSVARKLLDLTERFAVPIDVIVFDRAFRLRVPVAIYQLVPSVCVQSNDWLPEGASGRSESTIGGNRGRFHREGEIAYRTWKVIEETCKFWHRVRRRRRIAIPFMENPKTNCLPD